MHIHQIIKDNTITACLTLFNQNISSQEISLNETRKEFDGDVTLLVFPFVRYSKKTPEETATMLGEYLVANANEIIAFNVVKGFLNLSIADSYWVNFLKMKVKIINLGN